MAGEPGVGLEPGGEQSDDPRALAGAAGGREAGLLFEAPKQDAQRLAKRLVAELALARAFAGLGEERGLVEASCPTDPASRTSARLAVRRRDPSKRTTRQSGRGGSKAMFQRRPIVPCEWPAVSIQFPKPGSRAETMIRKEPSGSSFTLCLLTVIGW